VYPLVLNGIAYDKATSHQLVTGKCWPNVYEITLTPRPK
jgi:glutamine cyclotransferase